MNDIDQLRDLVRILRSTTRPLQDNEDPGIIGNQWDELEVLVENIVNEYPVAPNGSEAIAARVRELLDQNWPGAQLPEEALTVDHLVYFKHKDEYLTIKIEA